MLIREAIEMREAEFLSPAAVQAAHSRGRDKPEEECPIRTVFQRDRDRIVHCNAYRRMMHKTQVFLSPEGDHYRTRLTHTLEVGQIARTMARAMRLNEDLTEAIAAGHDLGHTPFGHAGERALNTVSPQGFVHSVQSVRVVEKLEKDGRGLNLTWEVRDGILHHSSEPAARTLEGQIVRYADKIAYLNHDIEDAIRAGILAEKDIPWDIQYLMGRSKSERITAMVTSVIHNSADRVTMGDDIQSGYEKLREFMFSAVYTNPVAKGEETKAIRLVTDLYHYFLKNPHKMPLEYATIIEEEGVDRGACDYIAGMSDRFAVNTYSNIFIPKSWGI